MAKCKVVGCKELSILKDYRANINDPEQVIKKINVGEVVDVDTSHTYWSMDDRQYYKLDLGYGAIGYVRTKGLKVVL